MPAELHDLRALFQRVVVISLERRTERWCKFLQELPADWPFGPPLRFPAIDGATCDVPEWWDQGVGAWGCYLSHKQIIQDCIHEDIESVLILEDDAVFLNQFGSQVRRFVSSLPDDWRLIYLGGQHIELHAGLPTRVNSIVYRPFNVNRMHAYAVRGRDMLQRVHAHISDHEHWTAQHHIDHHMGELQKSMTSGLYVPNRWLVAQGSGRSDINQRKLGLRSFRDAEDIVNPLVSLPMVAVLGPFSGGTSALAGVLHHLGISMGSAFPQPDRTNAKGHFEASELGNFCRKMFKEPWMTSELDRATRVQLLKIWAASHSRAFDGKCDLVGGKHPSFCLMGSELSEAWNHPRFIAVDRDLDEVINSLARRNWGWPLEACLLVSQQLIAAKEHFLATTDAQTLRVAYRDLVGNPRGVINEICHFLEYTPSPAQRMQAIEHVVGPRKRSE